MNTILERTAETKCLELAKQYPVVTVTGPRQSGKTTMVRKLFSKKPYVNLEDPSVREYALEDPKGFLKQYPNGAVLDEIQRVPNLTSYIQVIVDESQDKGLYILTGSQQFSLTHAVTQSLAGRTGLIRLLPLSLEELYGSSLKRQTIEAVLFKGFYPRVYQDSLPPEDFYTMYFETYVERDIRQLSQVSNLRSFERFVKLLAGRVGQLLNMSSLANDCGVSHTTVSHWVSILEASYILFLLPPWHGNIGKRLTKSPKVYFTDIGFASSLLGISSQDYLQNHPLKGNLFENMLILEFLKHRYNMGKRSNLYFYRDHIGNEVDLVIENVSRLTGVEIKMGQTPSKDFSKGLDKWQSALEKASSPLEIVKKVLYGGEEKQLRRETEFVSWRDIVKDMF
jgi:predicted AAA+ superfamily ATPase